MQNADVSDLQRPTDVSGRGMRDTTVLLAAVAPQQSNPSKEARAAPVRILADAVELSGGRVVRTLDSAVLALFRCPDAAARAAARMQKYADTLSRRSAGQALAVRVGFEHGPVGQRNDDVFGETVNLALQLVDEAKDGQILTTEYTALQLGLGLQHLVRGLGGDAAGGRNELLWEGADVFAQPVADIGGPLSKKVLRLSYAGKVFIRRRQGDSISIGRDSECGVRIAARTASRRHCTIAQCAEGFVLKDQSTNGTFIRVPGAAEVRIVGTDMVLPPRGSLSFGEPGDRSGHLVQFVCE